MIAKRSVNLCTIYVLPMLGLNRNSFSTDPKKFVNSYVSEDDLHVVVECRVPFTSITKNHPNYEFDMLINGSYIAVFKVPEYYKADVKKFRAGKYSKFTESAKTAIKSKSGLRWQMKVAMGEKESDIELLALDRAKELKKWWEDLLDVKLDSDAELMDIPGEENFYNLNLSNQLQTC